MERLAVSQRFDLALAAGLAAIATVEAATTSEYALPVELLLGPALAVPLVWRRTRPVVSLAGVLVVFALQRLVFGEIWDTGSAVAIPLVSAYSIAAYTPLRTAVAGLFALVGVIGAADLTSGGDAGDLGFILLIYGALWIAGLAVRRQRQLVDRVSMYVEELEQTQALREEAVAAEERVRIARELHDVVAHCVSTIVVQAEAGQSLIARDPVRAGDAFSVDSAVGPAGARRAEADGRSPSGRPRRRCRPCPAAVADEHRGAPRARSAPPESPSA